MPYVYYNPNPQNKSVGDCVVRALSKALDKNWEDTYTELCLQGFMMADLPSSNAVWGTYLLNNGFEEHTILRRCADCYTIEDFCNDHQTGTFVVGTDSHAVCCYMGNIYDIFDSSQMIPTYYFEKIEGGT